MTFHAARAALLLLLSCTAHAGPLAALPAAVDQALLRAAIPREAVALLVQPVEPLSPGSALPRLSHRAQVPMNPASVMKLVTTFAALDLLGPAYVWTTPVYLDGPVHQGTLQGNVYIQGVGDPKLVVERLWLLLRRLQGLGIRHIAGDIVLDHSAFDLAEADAARFDGEPLRPYNTAPDALLINYQAVVMTFSPERASGLARVQFDPPLYGVQMQTTVPLKATAPGATATCGDYRGGLQADFSDASRIRFGGSYPAECGEKTWPVAYADPRSYALRAVQGLWLEMGGQIDGRLRWGVVPAPVALAPPAFEVASPALAEIVRDINKYSNNVMAQQLFLTLGRLNPPLGMAPQGPGSFAASRSTLQRWWTERLGAADAPLLDNGSGLSRQERISAQGLARLLQLAWRSPTMSELMASLPISGVDGTLKRAGTTAGAAGAGVGSAHLKTGTLSQVLARAGYVDGASGTRYVLVALFNHPNATTEAARAAMDALVDWAVRDN